MHSNPLRPQRNPEIVESGTAQGEHTNLFPEEVSAGQWSDYSFDMEDMSPGQAGSYVRNKLNSFFPSQSMKVEVMNLSDGTCILVTAHSNSHFAIRKAGSGDSWKFDGPPSRSGTLKVATIALVAAIKNRFY